MRIFDMDLNCMGINNFMNNILLANYLDTFNLLLQWIPDFKRFLISREILTKPIPNQETNILSKLYFMLSSLHTYVLHKTFHDVAWQVLPLFHPLIPLLF